MNSSDNWECPKCQTLNASGTSCYSCGEPRPGAAAETAAPVETEATPTEVALPVAAGWDPLPEIEPDQADTEPHPCWCNLVKGPHDTRDHPAVADTAGNLLAEEEADAHLDQLEIELGQVSNNWTATSVERSYDSGDDGEQEYEDETMIFEEHGYSKLVERPYNAINATFTLGTGPS
jgi:hypothetical protein